jgi:DHA3 family tetracycline resistance protein-like MFS transporter
LNPGTVYLFLQFASSLLFSFIVTVNLLYQVTIVELSPLQLVLVGTTLEAAVFLFEIPTGLLADVKSRRLSIIVGYTIMGLGFILEGSVAAFWAVALGQAVWGLGYTFTSGATEAWIADEVGEAQAGETYLRGSQAARIGALVAIPLSVAVGAVHVRLPIVLGGGAMVLLALVLAAIMTEEGFRPTPPEERASGWWAAPVMMLRTMRGARALVRRQPVILLLLGIGLFFGLYSEGLDRLWTPHLLDNFAAPLGDRLQPVVWFGAIRAVAIVLSLVATEWVRRRVDTRHSAALGRALLLIALLIVLSLAGFGLAQTFWLALALFWLVATLRSVAGPLNTAWFNLQIDDPQVRATLFSVSGQVDAIGQIAGGPGVGAIGNRSIRAALVASALLLSPALPLYALAIRRSAKRSPDSGPVSPVP